MHKRLSMNVKSLSLTLTIHTITPVGKQYKDSAYVHVYLWLGDASAYREQDGVINPRFLWGI